MLTDGLTTHHGSHFSWVTVLYEQQRCAGSYNSCCTGEADRAEAAGLSPLEAQPDKIQQFVRVNCRTKSFLLSSEVQCRARGYQFLNGSRVEWRNLTAWSGRKAFRLRRSECR